MVDPLFSREEVLEGFPSRRASTLLFLIESRTAYLVAQSRQAMERFLTEEIARERSLAFLEAFAMGREAPLRPKLQDLENFAPQWASLVPPNPRVRAALAQLIAAKYDPSARLTPQLQRAIGMDQPEVQRAYERLYHQPLERLFSGRPGPRDLARAASAALGAKLEKLSPFWTAFALTLTETVGAGVLALPIALASVGPLGGVLILVVFGVANTLTIMYMSEAVARSGTIRYGSAYIGRAVSEYLGSGGAALLTLSMVGTCISALLAYYIGFSRALGDATGLRPELWVVLLFVVGIYITSRRSLDFTVATALIIGAVNILLIAGISVLALLHVRPENLFYVNLPLISGGDFDISLLSIVFGIVLISFFGHLSASNCGRVVLRRDPSGRTLVLGTGAAQVVAILLYSVWVVGVNGAVAPEVLANESGTALEPLAREIGPSVYLLGGVFVVLGMGMASIHYSLGLFNLVRERIPTATTPVVTMPKQRATLLLHPRVETDAEPRLTLTYLGLEGDRAHLRLGIEAGGRAHSEEIRVRDHWEIGALLARIPELAASGATLRLEVLDALPETLRLRVATTLALTYEGDWDPAGLVTLDLLHLPEPQARVLRWIVRQREVGVAEAAAFLDWDEAAARALLEEYADAGLLVRNGSGREERYRAHLAARRTRRLPESVWQAIGAAAGEESPAPAAAPKAAPRAPGISRWTRLGPTGRFLLSASPIAAIFLLAQWLYFTGMENFAKPIGIINTVTAALLAGILPVLLLAASRRRGEYVPGTVYRVLGHPVLLVGTYLLFFVGLLLHGLVIWQNPLLRALALVSSFAVAWFTVHAVRRGAFARRMVLELRQEPGEQQPTFFSLTDSGAPSPVEVSFALPDEERTLHAAQGAAPPLAALRSATFRLPRSDSRVLKVWAHRVTPEEDSEGLPVQLELTHGGQTRWFDLKLAGGHIQVPLAAGEYTVTLRPADPVRAAQASPAALG